ncbi:hypothetical protein EMGBS3_15150 [Anaerolineaceae bacterium]|nr:hypothetical protein EMGBS3_15150 [Anaerolineaceae bacterium]
MLPGWMRGVRLCVSVSSKPAPKHSAARPSLKARTCAAVNARRVVSAGCNGCPGLRSAGAASVAAFQITPSEAASSASVKKPACPWRTLRRTSPFTRKSERKKNMRMSPSCACPSM